jgi:hypothetical protein
MAKKTAAKEAYKKQGEARSKEAAKRIKATAGDGDFKNVFEGKPVKGKAKKPAVIEEPASKSAPEKIVLDHTAADYLHNVSRLNGDECMRIVEVEFWGTHCRATVAFDSKGNYEHVENNAVVFKDITTKVHVGQTFPIYEYGTTTLDALEKCEKFTVPSPAEMKRLNSKRNYIAVDKNGDPIKGDKLC